MSVALPGVGADLAAAALGQTTGPGGTLETLLTASDALGALIGLFIAYTAYRGYRRNESRPMFYLSLGFVLALGVPFAGLLLYTLTPVPAVGVAVVSQTSELVGLATIVYALRVEP